MSTPLRLVSPITGQRDKPWVRAAKSVVNVERKRCRKRARSPRFARTRSPMRAPRLREALSEGHVPRGTGVGTNRIRPCRVASAWVSQANLVACDKAVIAREIEP